jgi:DNA-binding IscR family transcriptional regulator
MLRLSLRFCSPRVRECLAREQRRITADEILRAASTADKTDRTPSPQSALFNSVVMPAVEQAERAFSAALTRINIEDLARESLVRCRRPSGVAARTAS